MSRPEERLAVALDVPDLAEALHLAAALAGKCGVFKVGLELFAANGPAAIQAAASFGAGVFLDLKIHDIPRTAAAAVSSAARHAVQFVTLHALGGPKMIRAARDAAELVGDGRPKLLVVTVLTSHDADELATIGLAGSPRENVMRLADMALEAGADGLVCSPEEVGELRDRFGTAPVLVTPGIRPSGSAAGDQVRIATPDAAIRAGADLIVVGRPIVKADDPAAAADRILAEIALAVALGGPQ